MSEPQAVDTLSFEDALVELETIVRKLETGEAPLDDSISAYERGIKLKKHCESKLRDAQEKIEKISIDPDGKVTTQPLDTEES
tara:strand:+ start:2252 stop:2500 length:249 start_codon:yes stop_codon:yes gene_type:complete